MVLHTLHLPYNLSESYFSARLTEEERHKLIDLINRRINTRIPSAYLVSPEKQSIQLKYNDGLHRACNV
jgi:methylase of polypeptide subunit release factors